MTITWGNIRKYLRMNIDYSYSGKVKLYMVYYVVEVIDNTPEDTKWESETPAAHHLFVTTEYENKISQTNAELSHHFVAQLLYLKKRDRSDI